MPQNSGLRCSGLFASLPAAEGMMAFLLSFDFMALQQEPPTKQWEAIKASDDQNSVASWILSVHY